MKNKDDLDDPRY